MSMIEIHKHAKEDYVKIRLHEFRASYKRNNKIIYSFCEGKEDLHFYRGPIENHLHNEWTVKMWYLNGIDNLLELHEKISKIKYNRGQVIFFVDRDLTEFTGRKIPKVKNIYITDNYSIENDLVNKNTCDRILTEIFGFSDLSTIERTSTLKLFEKELSLFIEQLVPIMARIIHWRRCGSKACLNNICMDHIFTIKKGVLSSIAKPKKHANITEYIHKQCNETIDIKFDSNKAEAEFRKDNKHTKFTRGKYLIWFLTEFCLSIHRDCIEIFSNISKQPKTCTNMSHSNAISCISSRFRVPSSLKLFLESTIAQYVNKIDAA